MKKWKHAATDNSVWHEYQDSQSQHDAVSPSHAIIKATAVLAIHSAWCDETLESSDAKVMMPKSVATNKAFKVGALVLSPGIQTVQVKDVKVDEKMPLYTPSNLILGTTTIDEKVYAVVASGVSPHIKKENCRNTKPTTIVPYWMVDVTKDEAEANMKLSMDVSKHTIDIADLNVKVPLIRNSKALKVGDKLVLFVPPPVQLKAFVLKGQPALRKAKTMKEQ